jgi:hypothetical protein
VARKGETIIAPSLLGLDMVNPAPWKQLDMTGATRRSVDQSYSAAIREDGAAPTELVRRDLENLGKDAALDLKLAPSGGKVVRLSREKCGKRRHR